MRRPADDAIDGVIVFRFLDKRRVSPDITGDVVGLRGTAGGVHHDDAILAHVLSVQSTGEELQWQDDKRRWTPPGATSTCMRAERSHEQRTHSIRKASQGLTGRNPLKGSLRENASISFTPGMTAEPQPTACPPRRTSQILSMSPVSCSSRGPAHLVVGPVDGVAALKGHDVDTLGQLLPHLRGGLAEEVPDGAVQAGQIPGDVVLPALHRHHLHTCIRQRTNAMTPRKTGGRCSPLDPPDPGRADTAKATDEPSAQDPCPRSRSCICLGTVQPAQHDAQARPLLLQKESLES